MEIVGAGKESVLAGAAKVGQEQNASAVNIAQQNNGVVICAG